MVRLINPNLEAAKESLADVGFFAEYHEPDTVVAGICYGEGRTIPVISLWDGTWISPAGQVLRVSGNGAVLPVEGETRAVPSIVVTEGENFGGWGLLYTAQNYEEASTRGWRPRWPVPLADFDSSLVEGGRVCLAHYTLKMGNEIAELDDAPDGYVA